MWRNSAKAGLVVGQGTPVRPAKAFVRTKWTIIGIVVGVIGSSVARTGLPKPEQVDSSAGSAARTVGAIDGTVRSMTNGVQEVSSSVKDQFDRAKATSECKSLKARVEASFLENGSLNFKKVVVTVDENGVVVMKGEVPTDSDKEQAVALAQDIRGVVRVEDHLALTPKPRVFKVPPSASRHTRSQASGG